MTFGALKWSRDQEGYHTRVGQGFERTRVIVRRTISGRATLKATQGQIDGFLIQLPYKCHLEEVASGGY